MSRHDIHTLQFSDLAEAAHFARSTPRADCNPDESSRAEDFDWNFGCDLKQAIRIAEGTEYWDGVTQMMDAMEITDSLAARADLPRVTRSLVGGAVNMGAYLSGHPIHMRRRTKQPAVDRPVLTIGVSLGISCIVTGTQRLNLGAAVMSAIDQLERSGYRCEVLAFWRCSSNNVEALPQWANIEHVLKAPDAAWNPSAMAFAIAHPAFQRHLTWRIAETQPEYNHMLRGCYGSNSNTEQYMASCAGDFDVFIPHMHVEAQECSTPEGAFAYVQRAVTEQMARAERAGRGE